METKEMKAVISKKFSKSAWILLACWVVACVLVDALVFLMIGEDIPHYDIVELCTVLFILLILIPIVPPLIYFLINRRKRKLTELTATETEIVGSYIGFIPISKITLKMPIEKIDNIAAVKNFFFLYTGKALRVASTSGAFRIPYVINADEMVAFISEAIEKAKSRPVQTTAAQPERPQIDAADSLKKFAELRDAGIITEEEFNQKKSELLGKM